MADQDDRVLQETLRFEAALPDLRKRYPPGRWVVFHEAKVASDHDSSGDAYAAAVAAFGPDGGFVIAPIAETKATPLSDAVLFGVAGPLCQAR